MRNQTDVEVLDEVGITYQLGGVLCLQAARYHHADGTTEDGFRFIWRDAQGGALKLQRGQARLPNFRSARMLMAMADGRQAFQNHEGVDASSLPQSVNL